MEDMHPNTSNMIKKKNIKSDITYIFILKTVFNRKTINLSSFFKTLHYYIKIFIMYLRYYCCKFLYKGN